MENPAHVYTTGIPMSQKGNLIHNKHGHDESGTLLEIRIPSISDHDYQNSGHLILNSSASENVEYISNSIQNGFQSEILCDFVRDAGLPSEDVHLENDLEVGSITETPIKFPDSPGSPFQIKLCGYNSIENFVPCLDEHLDSYLIPEFKSENKSESDDPGQYSEEENRTVTEAISAIAKSFGLENLLPENFQNDNNAYDTSADLCDEDNNITEISLGEFEKCTVLHSPTSLDIGDPLPENVEDFELSNLEVLPPSTQSSQCPIVEASQMIVKTGSSTFTNFESANKNKINCLKGEQSPAVNEIGDYNYEVKSSSQIATPFSQSSEQENLDNEVPLMQIPDDQENVEICENHPAAGTVLITRDKNSNKMQIVLTLDQGQQIYDVDTDSIDVNEHTLGLEIQNALNEQPLQTVELNSVNFSTNNANETEQVCTALLNENINQLIEEEPYFETPVTFMEVVNNIPVNVTKSGKKKIYECPVELCGQTFDKECKLKIHMFSHNESGRPFKCSAEGCNWAFTTPYRLRRHEETHLGAKEYICDVEGCDRKFTTVYNLKTHIKRHKWGNSLTCPAKDCQLSFSNRRKLELHLRIHKDVEAPYKCNLCGKQYYSANCIASHYRTHQYNEDDFKCPFQGCGKVYDKICRLKQHIRHHTGDRPYSCPAEGCNWSFMSASKLTRHMRKHTGERKFVCTEPGCGKSFMRPEHLKGHVVIHSGDRPFHCPHENCSAKFTAKSSLYVHLKKHCPSILKVVYPCPIAPCVKKYNSKATLKQHLGKFHPEMIGEGKEFNIAEKLELTMPVSIVSKNSEDSSSILELEESVTDDPSSELLGIQSSKATSSSSKTNLGIKSTNSRSQSKGESKVLIKSSANSQHVKLYQKTKNGCARTDVYCEYLAVPRTVDTPPSYAFLNQNNDDTQDMKNFLSSQLNTEIKSPDVMLASTIILQDQSSENFLKSNFLPDECSNGLYHEDSLLINSSAFDAELIPVSLLSDSVESNESVLIDTSSVIFSEQNGDFIESISLHGLD